MAAVVNVMASANLGASGSGAGNAAWRGGTVGAGETQAGSPAPAATVSLSDDGRALLVQIGALGGGLGSLSRLGNAFGVAANQPLLGVSGVGSASNVADRLVDAAVLAALIESTRDDEDEKKQSGPANALVVAAAVQAYMQVANLASAQVVTSVAAAGGISISIGAAA